MEIFKYAYMNKALIVGLVISLIIPFMGIVVVNKKISIIGDALSHVSLAGVMIGLIMSSSPIIWAIISCVLASLLMDFIRKKFPGYEEISTAIIMSTGIGFASILSGFVKKSANFESYLFGSIIAISDFEFYLIIITSIIVFLVFLFLYRDLLYISFDETSARLSGVNVSLVNTIFMILISVTISVSARTVGILIISSLMVIPTSCALQFRRGYFKTILLSLFFGVVFTIFGIILSFYLGLKPGGSIVLVGVFTLLFILIFKNNLMK